MAASTAPNAEDVLAWEDEHRQRAGVAAIVAGLLTIVGALATAMTLRDKPVVTVFDGLRDAAGRPPSSGGLKTDTVLFIHDNALALTAGQIATAFGGLLAAAALAYLFVATRARRAGLGQMGLGALAVGGVAFFVGSIVPQIAVDLSAADFASSADHSTAAAHDALAPTAALVGALIGYIGTLALGVGFVVTALNAMRVGLLTRFMGILGVVAGILFVIPLASLPIIQAFWLVALGALVLRRWPSGMPPAWETGQAEPWPSRQEQLEAAGGSRDDDQGDEGDEPATAPPSPRAKKKKRRG